MTEKSGITGPMVESDDPNLADEPSNPVEPGDLQSSFDAVKHAVQVAKGEIAPDEEAESEEQEDADTEQPMDGEDEQNEQESTLQDEAKAANPEPQSEPEDPLSVKLYTQKDLDERVQRAVDAVIRKERTREDSARKRINQLEIIAGIPFDQIIAQVRQNRVQSLVDRLGIDETEARQLVEAEEERARLKAEREQILREREFEKKQNEYLAARNAFLSDRSVPAEIRAFAQKYANEIDLISDFGRAMTYEVARDYVLGRKMAEILKARELAAEQKVLAKVQKGGTKPPAPNSGKPPASEPVLTAAEKQMAYALYANLSKAEAERRYAKAKAELAKMRGQR